MYFESPNDDEDFPFEANEWDHSGQSTFVNERGEDVGISCLRGYHTSVRETIARFPFPSLRRPDVACLEPMALLRLVENHVRAHPCLNATTHAEVILSTFKTPEYREASDLVGPPN